MPFYLITNDNQYRAEGVFIAPWHLALSEQGEKSKVPESSGFIFICEDTGKTYKETGYH